MCVCVVCVCVVCCVCVCVREKYSVISSKTGSKTGQDSSSLDGRGFPFFTINYAEVMY